MAVKAMTLSLKCAFLKGNLTVAIRAPSILREKNDFSFNVDKSVY